MKKIILLAVLAPLFSNAAAPALTTYIFEPYFETNYACNYLEGANAQIVMTTATPEEAVAQARTMLNRTVAVTCNQDRYMCVHHNGDLEPRVVEYKSSEKNYEILGGRVMNPATYEQVAQLNEVGYHGHLRPLPKCKY
ncbi:MAG: hypothetical protein K2P92_09445 [Bdellovibrionaceae bacterium]|nr:hypothetical protein [Pseudobdellovibrionaceae bacterium]